MDDEREIRALVERWAAAVHAGDLEKGGGLGPRGGFETSPWGS